MPALATDQRRCCFCRQLAPRGVCDRCLDQALGEKIEGEPLARPCGHCPFRRDRENWMDSGQLFVNTERVLRGRVQNCHNAPDRICAGIRACLRGGDDVCISPGELFDLPPVDDPAAARRTYDAAGRP